MKTKQQLRLEIKEISAEGYFEGILSPYGNVDGGGDVVEPGAYTKTLLEKGNKRPLLWQHKSDTPIGDLTLEDRVDGLWCKGQLLMALPEAQKAYLLIKARIVKGLSIGFQSIKDSIENGVRRLKEIALWEGSIVTFPMNEMALITSVKNESGVNSDFNEGFTELQLHDAGYQMRSALASALHSVIWADLSRDEKSAATQAVIQQFSDAYMAYLPAYLDTLVEEYGDMKTWGQRLETKKGRAISAANKSLIKEAHSQNAAATKCMKSAMDILCSLFSDEADNTEESDDTSQEKAGQKAKPEPAAPQADHSAATKILDAMRSLIPAA